MLGCDGTGFIFMLELHTYAPIMTGWKDKWVLPTAGMWTEMLSWR